MCFGRSAVPSEKRSAEGRYRMKYGKVIAGTAAHPQKRRETRYRRHTEHCSSPRNVILVNVKAGVKKVAHVVRALRSIQINSRPYERHVHTRSIELSSMERLIKEGLSGGI